MIAFGDPAHYVESKEVAPGIVVDFDKDGKPIAVELEDVAAVMDPRELQALVHPRISKGADLRSFRERLGLTQEQLGALIDIPRNTIARWERDELPIAKTRQLELALSALLRPEADRTFRIVFSEENEGEGDLECGFCGPVEVLYDIRRGTPMQIIYEHSAEDFPDDETQKVKQCPNRLRWKSTTWELRNKDNGAIVAYGVVRVAKGAVEVETTSDSRKSA
jgi:transcriptional regulator with XRE-family HTH domain/uncharacterized protein YuzE